MPLADVFLTLAPGEKSGLVVHLRLGTDEAGDPAPSGDLDAAQVQDLQAACRRLRQAEDAPARERALLAIATRTRRLVVDRRARRAPLAFLRGLADFGPRDPQLPSRRIVIACEDPVAHGILFEALGAGPYWPGLLDQWQWLRYAPPTSFGASSAVKLELTSVMHVLCVVGSLEQETNRENARHAALALLRRLRLANERPRRDDRCRLSVRFVLAADELQPLLAAAQTQQLEEIAAWLRRLDPKHSGAGARPADAVVVTKASDLVAELESAAREVLLWLGHSNARANHSATGLVVLGSPTQPKPDGVLPFGTLARALAAAGDRTRLVCLLACRTEPSAALGLVEHTDHVVVTDGWVHTESAARFGATLLDAVAALQPVGEAVRVARALAFANPIDRWQVQHWTRTLDARPFVDRRARAVAEYLEKTPERPAGEERSALDFRPGSSSRMRPADWHVRHCIDLRVDEDWDVVGRGAATRAPAPSDERRLPHWHDAPAREPGASLRAQLGKPDPKQQSGSGRWLVLGEPGSGKSTMLQRERILMAQARGQPFVPIFVKLATWASNERDLAAKRLQAGQGFDLEDYVEERFCMVGTDLAAGLRQRAAHGEVCYLLDGLDEVGDEAAQERVHDLLVALAESRPLCPIVVTSRPVEAQSYELGPFTRVGLRPLGQEQQVDILRRRLGFDADAARALLARWHDQPTLVELARNPLFLTLLALIEGKTPAQSTPATRPHQILDHVVAWLLEGKHRQQKITWPKSASIQDVGEVLALLAFAWTHALHDVDKRSAVVEFLAGASWRDALPAHPARSQVIEAAVRRIAKAFADDWNAFVAHLLATGILGPYADDSPFGEERLQFGHRMLQENLASRAVADRWQAGGDGREELWRLAREVSAGKGRAVEQRLRFWAEPFALMAGRVGDPGPDAIVRELVANEATRPIGLRALINAQRLEPDTIVEVVASLADWGIGGVCSRRSSSAWRKSGS